MYNKAKKYVLELLSRLVFIFFRSVFISFLFSKYILVLFLEELYEFNFDTNQRQYVPYNNDDIDIIKERYGIEADSYRQIVRRLKGSYLIINKNSFYNTKLTGKLDAHNAIHETMDAKSFRTYMEKIYRKWTTLQIITPTDY